MAAIDKINEFYTAAFRFRFLARCYRPENLPEEVNSSLDVICNFFESDPAFSDRMEEAIDYFNKINDSIDLNNKKELLSHIVRELIS